MFDLWNWHTIPYLARLWGKAPRTIQLWCKEGFLIECGFKVLHFRTRTGATQWLIHVPEEDEIKCSSATLA